MYAVGNVMNYRVEAGRCLFVSACLCVVVQQVRWCITGDCWEALFIV